MVYILYVCIRLSKLAGRYDYSNIMFMWLLEVTAAKIVHEKHDGKCTMLEYVCQTKIVLLINFFCGKQEIIPEQLTFILVHYHII